MTENATQRVVEHGEASSLPEANWMFRRILIFLVAIAAIANVWRILDHATGLTRLQLDLAHWSLALQAFCVFVYVTGATASDVVKLVSAVRTTRKETVTTAPPPSTISPEGAVNSAEPGAGVPGDGELPPAERIR